VDDFPRSDAPSSTPQTLLSHSTAYNAEPRDV
jgi:hypothetical protein